MEKLFDINYFNKLYHMIHEYGNSVYNIQILEPINTIIILVIVSFKDEGVKIAIQDNKIIVQDYNFLQPINRWYHGNTREDIQYLLKPIVRALEMLKPFESENEKIKKLFEYAINGIEKLKISYNN